MDLWDLIFTRPVRRGKDSLLFDLSMQQLEEQDRLFDEATNCSKCRDLGVRVEASARYDVEGTSLSYHRCKCGAEPHRKLRKYLRED